MQFDEMKGGNNEHEQNKKVEETINVENDAS